MPPRHFLFFVLLGAVGCSLSHNPDLPLLDEGLIDFGTGASGAGASSGAGATSGSGATTGAGAQNGSGGEPQGVGGLPNCLGGASNEEDACLPLGVGPEQPGGAAGAGAAGEP